jgi:repressor LexA
LFEYWSELALKLGNPVSYREMKITHRMKANFTHKQGQYLAFIYNYTIIHRRAPAEADLARFFCVTPPTIHQMILKLEEKGLIRRKPGVARSIELLVDPGEIPRLLEPGS